MPRKVCCLLCVLAMLACGCNKSRDDRDESDDNSSPGVSWLGGGGVGKPPEIPAKKPSSYAGGKIEAKIKFTPGRYVATEAMDETGRQTMTMGVKSQKTDTESDMVIVGDIVINPPDAGTGERRITYQCTRVKMKTVQGGQRKSFDSDAPRGTWDRDLSKILGPLVGWKGVQVYSREGKFLRLEGLEHLLSQVAASAGPGGKQAVAMVKKLLEPLLKEMLTRHWGALLPEGPVGPGDTWRKTIELENFPMFGALAFQFACRVQDIEETPSGKILIFDVNGTASVTNRSLNMDFMPMLAEVDVKVEKLTIGLSFTVRFDTAIGLATAVTGKTRIKATMSISVPREGTTNMEMDQDAKFRYTLRPAGAGGPSK